MSSTTTPARRDPSRLRPAWLPVLVGAVLLCQGCTLLSVVRSERRDDPLESVEVSDTVRLTATGLINMYVIFMVDHEDLVPSSFRIEGQDRVVYIDPVLVDDGPAADLIFITHPHDDHFSLADIDKLSKEGTLIICPAEVAAKLGERPHRVVAPRRQGEVKGVRYETVPSYNNREGLLIPHPRKAAYTGFVIEVDGQRFFHPGDSDRLPEMETLQNIDVVLLPIEGGDLTMSTEDAAALANSLKPRLAVPMHYPPDHLEEVQRFRELVDPSIEVRVVQRTH